MRFKSSRSLLKKLDWGRWWRGSARGLLHTLVSLLRMLLRLLHRHVGDVFKDVGQQNAVDLRGGLDQRRLDEGDMGRDVGHVVLIRESLQLRSAIWHNHRTRVLHSRAFRLRLGRRR